MEKRPPKPRALEDGRSGSPGLTFGPIYTATLIDPAAQSQRLAQQLSIEMPPLEDGNPALHRAFDQVLQSLTEPQKQACTELGIVSLSMLNLALAARGGLQRAEVRVIEGLYWKVCGCKPGGTSQPVRPLQVDIVGYGDFRAPNPPPFRPDPLLIGMSGVEAGTKIEIRNRSKSIGSNVQPWITLPVDTAHVRAEDGRLHIAIGPDALRKMKFDAWDQFEIRQRRPDGEVSKPEVPDLGTARSDFRLPSKWSQVPVADIGDVLVPPASVFAGLPDTSVIRLDPRVLKRTFDRGVLEVSAAVPPGESFARFVEPRAHVYLKNLRTGAQTKPVQVAADGTFKAQVDGQPSDPYEMHVYDQAVRDGDLPSHRILSFSSAESPPIVAYSPGLGLPEPIELVAGLLYPARGALGSARGVTPGSVVTVIDLTTNAQTLSVADATGSFRVGADLAEGKMFEIRVENPFTHAENEERRKRGEPIATPFGAAQVLRVQVQAGGLVPVATDEYPPSARTRPVSAASLEERRFDPNTDLDFLPTTLKPVKNSRGESTGQMAVSFAPTVDVKFEGIIGVRGLFLSPDGVLQMVVRPAIRNAVVLGSGPGAEQSSVLGPRNSLDSSDRSLSFSPGDFLNGFRDHLTVQIVDPAGNVLGIGKAKPATTGFADQVGEFVESWALSDFHRGSGTTPLLGMDGLPPEATRAPHVRAKAWIEPSQKYDHILTEEQLTAFRRGQIPGTLALQVEVHPPPGRTLEDVQGVQVVNLNDHPTGFAEPGAIESAELKASGRTGLLELSPEATRRLQPHLGDQLSFRMLMKDGTTSRATQPIEVETPAKQVELTRPGDFISAGVVTRWEQIPVGATFEGAIPVVQDGNLNTKARMVAPPPTRSASDWKAGAELRALPNGLLELTWKPGTLPSKARFTLSYYAQSPYGADRFASTTTSWRVSPPANERSRLVFRAPGETGALVISVAGERLIYPPEMATDPRVTKLFE